MNTLDIILLCWVFIIYGFTQIIVESGIFEPIREYLSSNKTMNRLINCFLCVSVWVSGLLSIFIFSPTGFIWPQLHTISNIILDAMLGSSICWFLHCIEVYLVRKR